MVIHPLETYTSPHTYEAVNGVKFGMNYHHSLIQSHILCCRSIPVFGIPFINWIYLSFLRYLHLKKKDRRTSKSATCEDIFFYYRMEYLIKLEKSTKSYMSIDTKVKGIISCTHYYSKEFTPVALTLISGWVSMNSPRDGSRVNPLTPFPVLNTSWRTRSNELLSGYFQSPWRYMLREECQR